MWMLCFHPPSIRRYWFCWLDSNLDQNIGSLCTLEWTVAVAMFFDSFRASRFSLNCLRICVPVSLYWYFSSCLFRGKFSLKENKAVQRELKSLSSSRLLQIISIWAHKQAYLFPVLCCSEQIWKRLHVVRFSFSLKWNGEIDMNFEVFLWRLNEITFKNSKHSVRHRVWPFLYTNIYFQFLFSFSYLKHLSLPQL